MGSVTLEEAQTHLAELIGKLATGEELIIMSGQIPVAKIVSQPAVPTLRKRGLMKGMLTIVSEDDEHLEAFAEYM